MSIQLLYTVSFLITIEGFILISHVWIKVDQPAGTGFSYTSTDRYVHTTDVVGFLSTFLQVRVIRLWNYFFQAQQQLLEFLKNFYQVFPEYMAMDVCVFPDWLSVFLYLIHQYIFKRPTSQEKVLQANGYPIMVINNPF